MTDLRALAAILLTLLCLTLVALVWHVADLLQRDKLCVQTVYHGSAITHGQFTTSGPGINVWPADARGATGATGGSK